MTTTGVPYRPDERISKSNSTSDLTDMTDLPSDNDSVSEDITSTTSLDASNREQEKDDGGVAGNQRRVRFSIVYTREFDVVAEKENSRPSYKCLDSTISSTFTDSEIDIETHVSEKKQRRKEKYVRMIQYQINRVENAKELEQQKILEEKKGFRARVLKPMWKGFLEAASRSPMVLPMPGY
jgi:hypothetical protein